MSESSDRFGSIKAKILRAEQHLSDLEKLDSQYNQVECALTIQESSDTGISHFNVELPSPPNDAPMIVGDCLNNLRSSLDYVIWQIVDASKIAKPSNANMFPICDTEVEFKNQIKRNRLRGVPEDAVNQIALLQPYAGHTNQPLSLLNKLCNKDKHRDLHYSTTIASDMALSFYRNGSNVLNLVVGNEEIERGEIFGGIGFDSTLLKNMDVEIRGTAMASLAFRDLQTDFEDKLLVVPVLKEIVEFVKYEAIDPLREYFV